MWTFSWGVLALGAVTLIIFFGLAQRVLDRMGLTNWQAITLIALMVIGSFLDIPLWRGDIQVTLNLGGALVPILLCVYLLVRAGSNKERLRAILAALATGAATAVIGGVLMTGEVGDRLALMDPLYLYPLVAGLIAYGLGRSRRAAFVAATLGVMGLDLIHWIWLVRNHVPGSVYLGGGGVFDSIVFAGIFAVVLAEVVGEIRERLQGGPKEEGHDPALLAQLKKVSPEAEGNVESLGSGSKPQEPYRPKYHKPLQDMEISGELSPVQQEGANRKKSEKVGEKGE